MTSLRLVRALAIALSLAPTFALAQSRAETIRGTVRSDSGRVIAAANVIITRGPDRLVKQTLTDSTGKYAITFDTGTGDYLVSVSAAGFKAVRRRVERVADERTLTADFQLSSDIASLAAVRVTAAKPVRASSAANPYNLETGAAEKWSDGVDGQLAPTVAGDLNALAATMPGATNGPGGVSVLGSGPSSNLTTLNGMALGTAQLPRAARTETRFTGATFDPTRGGFSGSNTDVRLSGGDRNFQNRNTFFTVDVPELQMTDAVGRALGVRTQNLRASGGLDGEAIRRVLTYNVSADYARTASDPATLLGGDPLAYSLAGLARDSVARLRSVASARGIPLSGAGVPLQRERETFSALTRFDLTSDTTFSRSLSSYVTRVSEGALGFGPTAAPAAGGSRTENSMGAILSLGKSFGVGLSTLNLTKINVNRTSNESSPYLALPAASVLLRSSSAESEGLVGVGIGGNPQLASTEKRWTVEGSNETLRNVRGSRHSLKGNVWGRVDGLTQTGGGDLLGRYAFNSIDDLAAGRAASYSRAVALPDREGRVWNSAAAVAHSFAPSKFFSLLYGARVEGNGFLTTPAENPALATALGVSTGVARPKLHVSPRIGFNYSFNKSKGNGNGASMDQTGRYYRYPTGVLRGGIGEFRDLLQPGLIASAAARTGLPGSALSLNCVGSAIPVPAWDRFLTDPATIPLNCADGSGALGERAPSVSLIDPSFQVPRSWRASLDYNTAKKGFIIRLAGLASYDLNQASTVDANFAGTQRFTLPDEANRPVFVSTSAIDAASGALSPAESRRSANYGRVLSRVSDLRGRGGQITATVSGDPFQRDHILGRLRRTSLAYTLQQSRREFRGFDGGAFGDPRAREWAPSASDARHVITLQTAFSQSTVGTFTLFGRFQSGLPFTPVVSGDVNGDGRGGDRAFIPRASDLADSPTRSALTQLELNGSKSARNCLRANAGFVVGQNACRGPWSQTLNIMWRPTMPKKADGRVSAAVYLTNVLGGIDQLLHGTDGLRGWGSQPFVDPVLMVPRGFDAAGRRFRYDVNPRFAETRANRVLAREPFRLSFDVSLRLHTNYDLQTLRRAIEPQRINGKWERRGEDSLMALYLNQTSSIHLAIVSEADSLFLSRDQVVKLRRADSLFAASVRDIYRPLAKYLAGEGGERTSPAALAMVDSTTKRYWRLFWQQPEVADSLVTPLQRDLMEMLKGMLATEKKDRENSQWFFGHQVPLVPKPVVGAPVVGRP
ncbi:MAG: carboxypeptidase-like regulatory domain-containing protein [Gemmatimonadaceae bacterium]|nr:carboxypeptidase-like regulatory domain-containing protein [Gemmatimonadaceae bacterium]